MEITYGHPVTTDDDPYVELADKVNQVLTDMGDTSLIDLFPICKHIIFTRYMTFHCIPSEEPPGMVPRRRIRAPGAGYVDFATEIYIETKVLVHRVQSSH